MITVGLVDTKNHNTARISKRGEVSVGPIEFSQFYFALLGTDNTPVNVVVPKTRKIFIITAIVLAGNRNIGVNGSIVDIYESSDGPATATQTNLIYEDEIAKQTRSVLTMLNIKVSEGNWVNAVCDDDDVRVNIAGYYLDA